MRFFVIWRIMMKTPILLIAYKRPDTTKKVLEAISRVKPNKLYISQNIPSKMANLDEVNSCNEVERLFLEIDWECELFFNKWHVHKPAKESICDAISWVFNSEDRVIIIEDDVVAVPSFFFYSEELLEKYKDDERIAMISGNNYTPIKEISSDYFFTKYGHIWGWATWKRVWDKFDVNLPFLENDITSGFDKINYLTKDEFKYFKKRWKHLFEKINNDTINTWDYQFSYFRMINNLISIAPRVNLVSNIGLFSSRTGNTSKNNDNYVPADSDFILLKHPAEIRISLEYEKYHFKKIINKKSPLSQRVYRKIIRIIKG